MSANPINFDRHARKVLVAQRGAREHFLIPRSLESFGMLSQLVVDYNGSGSGLAATLGRSLPGPAGRRARGARVDGSISSRAIDLGLLGLLLKAVNRLGDCVGRPFSTFLWTDRHFAKAIARCSWCAHDVFFGYSYASLEMLAAEKKRGVMTILGQIDPGKVEEDMVEEERTRWPQYESPGILVPPDYWERNRQEWALSDLILVNSKWTAEAIIRSGADPKKVEILPLAYDLPVATGGTLLRNIKQKRLQVLWLGTVGLRKGIPYLLEAARQLVNEPVDFTIAGPIQINRERIADSPPNVRWMGAVPRSETSALFAEADVFVLPTISDGFAITQLEALAHGVPVITTPNCGAVVDDGKSGFIVPARSCTALADAVMMFVRDPELSLGMQSECLAQAQSFGIDAHAANFKHLLLNLLQQHSVGI